MSFIARPANPPTNDHCPAVEASEWRPTKAHMTGNERCMLSGQVPDPTSIDEDPNGISVVRIGWLRYENGDAFVLVAVFAFAAADGAQRVLEMALADDLEIAIARRGKLCRGCF